MIRLEPRFAELAAMTNFSFLRGASHPEEMVARAAELGLAGIGIADHNSLAGVVRAHTFARDNAEAMAGTRVVPGARLVFIDGAPDTLVYPKDRAAYGRLCRILTAGNLRAPKGECWLRLDDLLDRGEGLQVVALPSSSPKGDGKNASLSQKDKEKLDYQEMDEGAAVALLREAFGKRLWIGASLTYGTDMRGGLARRVALARSVGAPLIATNDALMHTPERRRSPTSSPASARRPRSRPPGALRKPTPSVISKLHTKWRGCSPTRLRPSPRPSASSTASPSALTNSGIAIRKSCARAMQRPKRRSRPSPGKAQKARYPDGVPERTREALTYELTLIASLDYAPYFLTVHDIVRFARSKEILCQGRGSAANSAVCYCLGITEVDPANFDLLFERFISPERNEPPDIDVDFEHERREEVIQYIYEHYGRERAGLAAAVITYRTRSAIRETAKVFSLSDDVIAALNGTAWGQETAPIGEDRVRAIGLDPADPTLKLALEMAKALIGFPRHLTQHSGGFVITRDRLDEVVPVMNTAMDKRTMVEWDKDDLDALGLLKVDVLALGMLTALSKGFKLLDKHYGERLTLASIPPEEACVYAMIQRADTIGVFQIESRAQMSMLPRLKPASYYDLVIEVAIVRPGPIQGDMVHPYLRRRQGLEDVSYPSKELEAVLSKTLGVPLFQEQAMKIAIVAAGFTPSEADQLRRAMATFRRSGTIQTLQEKMIEGMVANGYPREFAERCFHQIEGFGEYGFPESHAASFALLVYASCWMKCRYPDVFVAAMLNAQPLGFYAPAQLVRDAREHGVEVREVDVNLSDWDCTLELSYGASRHLLPRGEEDSPLPIGRSEERPSLDGLWGEGTGVRGFTRATPRWRRTSARPMRCAWVSGRSSASKKRTCSELVERRGEAYDSVRDLWLRSGLSSTVLERLADADAFRSLGLDRRQALWAVRGLDRVGDQDDLPLFASRPERDAEPDARLPPMPLGAHVVEDYRRLSLSLKAHPASFMRSRLSARGILRSETLRSVKNGERITVAGLVLVRQRPGTAGGVIFMTLEDETGVANIIVWPKVFERLRAIVLGARFVAVTGKLQSEQGVIHIVAERMNDLTPMLGLLSEAGHTIGALARADEAHRTEPTETRKRQGNRFAQPPRFDDPRATPFPPIETVGVGDAMPAGRNFR